MWSGATICIVTAPSSTDAKAVAKYSLFRSVEVSSAGAHGQSMSVPGCGHLEGQCSTSDSEILLDSGVGRLSLAVAPDGADERALPDVDRAAGNGEATCCVSSSFWRSLRPQGSPSKHHAANSCLIVPVAAMC